MLVENLFGQFPELLASLLVEIQVNIPPLLTKTRPGLRDVIHEQIRLLF